MSIGDWALDGVFFLHSNHRPECVDTVDKVFGYHTVQLMTSGSVRLSYDGVRHDLDGAWLWTCQPGLRIRFHEWPRGTPWNHRHLAVTGPRVAAWDAAGLWPRDPWGLGPGEVGSWATEVDRIIALSSRPDRRSRLRAAARLELLLLDWCDRAAVEADETGWLAQVMTAIQRPAAPDYPAIAARVGLSLSTLQRRFRQATGSSLHDVHLEWRIIEARRLLGDTDRPIKAIAEDLGYGDVFYFTRQFTRRVGIPPARYRRDRHG